MSCVPKLKCFRVSRFKKMYILALSSYLDLLALSLSHDRFEASGERY